MSQFNQQTVTVTMQRESEAENLPLPTYATTAAAGMDLYAALPADGPVTLRSGERAVVSTGLRIGLPAGYEAQVRPRSGLAANHGIGILNAPGTIDADFMGVLRVILINWGAEPYTIHRGDRIAQLVVAPVTHATLIEVKEIKAKSLETNQRGEGGFGSTGR